MMWIPYAMLLIAVVSLPGCSHEENTPPLPRGSVQEGKASDAVGTQSRTGSFLVKVLPESPTEMTDLEVVHCATGTVTYQWQRNDRPIPGATGERLAVNSFTRDDTVSVIVRAGGREETASVVIGAPPPKVVSVTLSPKYICAGVDITASPVGDDPDDGETQYHYHWAINGQAQPEDTPVLRGDKFKRGDVISLTVIPVIADDEGVPSAMRPVVVPNAPPRITSNPPREYRGGVYSYRVVAVDPDGDALAYSLGAAPSGMSIDGASGLITWPITAESAGPHIVEIVAQDSPGAKTEQKYTLTITIPEGENK